MVGLAFVWMTLPRSAGTNSSYGLADKPKPSEKTVMLFLRDVPPR